jgi:hypothetical protein
MKSLLKPISTELALRNFECDVVENAVHKLVDKAYKVLLLRSSLGFQGTVTFKRHTNLGTADDDPISEPTEHMLSVGPAPVQRCRGRPRPRSHRRLPRPVTGQGESAIGWTSSLYTGLRRPECPRIRYRIQGAAQARP